MRPTNTQVQNFGPTQDAQVPQVGLQVSASPVQFAADESKFRQLEMLKNQLATFNSGAMANAQLQDKLQKQQDQQQAELDFAKDHSKFDATKGSGYYYMHGMDLMGEAEAVKMGARMKAQMADLLSNPDKLRGTDLNQFFQDSVSKELSGVNDPIVAKHLNNEVSKLGQTMLPALTKAQLDAENQYRRDTSHFIFSQRADTPDNTRVYLQSDFNNMVSRLGKDTAVEVVTGVLANKIAESQTSDEAQSWLSMFGTKIPGTTGPDGKAQSFAMIGGEKMANGLSKLRQSVTAMKEAETKAMLTKVKEAEAEVARLNKEEQQLNFTKSEALLGDAADPKSLADGLLMTHRLNLAPNQRELLLMNYQQKLGKMAVRAASDMENPEALTKQFAQTVQTGDWQKGVETANQTITRLQASSDPSALRGYISGLFKDLSAMKVDMANGGAQISAHNQALLGVYSSIANKPELLNFIPEQDQRFARVLTGKMTETSGNLALALKETQAAMQVPMKAIPHADAQSVVETFLDKTVSQKLMGDYGDVTPAAQNTVRLWAAEQMKDMSLLAYPTKDDQKRALETRFHNQFMVLSSGIGPWHNTDVVFLGPQGNQGYTIKDASGKPVQRQFNETDMTAAWKQIKGSLEGQGYKDVTIRPYDTSTGDHVISYSVNGTKVDMPFHVTQLNEAAYRLAEEHAKGIDLKTIMDKPVIGSGVGSVTKAWDVAGKVFGSSSRAPENGAIAKFVEQLQLGLTKADVNQSVHAVANTVTGAAQDKVKQDLFNQQLNALATRARR